jgi:histone H3/H4
MMTIELEQLSKDTVERLQRLAQQHGLRVEDEALKCIERGLSEIEQVELELLEIRKLRESMPGVWVTEEAVRAARNEGRP